MAVTAADVKAITGSTLDDPAIEPFIKAAECIVERARACINGQGVSDECIDRGTTFLAAHLLVTSPVGQKSATKKMVRFENYTTEYIVGTYDSSGLLSTPQGDAANSILGGCLVDVSKAPLRVTFFG